MIGWGGATQSVDTAGRISQESLADGAMYDPDSDTWTTTADAPIGSQDSHIAIWTDVEMIILGAPKAVGGAITLPGAAFDPSTGLWRSLPELTVTPAESPPGSLAAVWTGAAVVAVGAAVGSRVVAVYRPSSDEWDVVDSPIGERSGHTAVWTGAEVIIWGGSERASELPVGYAFSVDTGTWRALSPPPVTERGGHGAAWTGDRILIWGGTPTRPLSNPNERLSFGMLYDPQRDDWLAVDAAGTPDDAIGPTPMQVVWLGDRAILWNNVPHESGILSLTR